MPTAPSGDPAVAFIRGIYHWRKLQPDEAIAIWLTAWSDYGAKAQSCADALQAVGKLPADPRRAPAVEQIRSILDL